MTGNLPRSNLAMISVACMLATWGTSQASAQSNLRDRVSAAVETVEGACAADISNFCGKVTRGEGRILSCMQAYDDQLSRRCQFAFIACPVISRVLSTVSSGSLTHVGMILKRTAGMRTRSDNAWWRSAPLCPKACQTVVANLRKAVQGLAALRGLPVHSSDNSEVGQVVEVAKAPDGTVQSIQIEIGRSLGISPKVVTINADKFEQLADRVRLQLGREEVQRLPEATKR